MPASFRGRCRDALAATHAYRCPFTILALFHMTTLPLRRAYRFRLLHARILYLWLFQRESRARAEPVCRAAPAPRHDDFFAR